MDKKSKDYIDKIVIKGARVHPVVQARRLALRDKIQGRA